MLTTEQQRGLFICLAAVLLGCGVLMVHSASITSWPTQFERVFLSRHLTFLAIGVAAACVAALLPARFWMAAAPWIFVVTLGLLVAVLIPGIGPRINGAQRWLRHGSLSMQPSELAKIALPLMLARIMEQRRESLHGWWSGTIPILLPILLVVPLVAIEPDLGTSLFLLTGAAITLFLGGWPIRNFVVGAVCAVPAAIAFVSLKPYQWKRISGFLAAWSDWNQAPYQLQQSLVSMGAGGISGVGIGRGWQKLSFLPEANTDFVFAVVGEELGLLGTLGLVGLWAGLFACGLMLLNRLERRRFAHVAGMTLLTQLVFQAALNIAVVTAMVPPKGIPHPLLSYGGSNLIVSVVSLGIVLSLTQRNEPTMGLDAE